MLNYEVIKTEHLPEEYWENIEQNILKILF